MTSNWKKQCAALALAAAMTASSVVSPLVYAADAALQAEVAVSASAGSEPPQEEESQQEPEAPAEQQLEQPAAQKALSWVDSDALAMGWQTDFSKTQATTVRYWKDGVLPSDLPEAWDASPAKGTFWLEVTPDETGESAIHCHSEDASARYALMNTKLYGFDYQKNYVLRAWVKAENVSGTGLYMRGQVGAGANKNLGDGYKVKGTTGGWVLYEWSLRDLAEAAGDNADRMKVEVYFEKFTGDLWVKDLKIVEDYKLTLDQTELTGQVGNVLTLNVKADSDQVDLSKLAWTSSELHHNEALGRDIVDALTWYHDHVYNENYNLQQIYGNWWHWWIGIPQDIGSAAILMYSELDKEFIDAAYATLRHFNEDPTKIVNVWGSYNEQTGANLADTSLVAALRSAIGNNQEGIGLASSTPPPSPST